MNVVRAKKACGIRNLGCAFQFRAAEKNAQHTNISLPTLITLRNPLTMPPKKTAPPTPKRGTKRGATPGDVEMQPVPKRTSTRATTPVVALPARRSTRASTAEPAKRTTIRSASRGGTPGPGGQRRAPFVYAPKTGMNALPAAPEASQAKRQLFVFGNGDMGQHGLGIEMIDEIKRPRLHAWVAEKNEKGELGAGGLEMIAAGGMHTLAIDSTGRVSRGAA